MKSIFRNLTIFILYHAITAIPAYVTLAVLWSDSTHHIDRPAMYKAGAIVTLAVIFTIPLRRRPLSLQGTRLAFGVLLNILTGCILTVLLHDFVAKRSHGSHSSSLLPGFHDAISAANHSTHCHSSQDHHNVYSLLLDVGHRADENEEMLSSLLPRLHGGVEWLEAEVSVPWGHSGSVDHPILHIQQISPPPPVAKPLAFILTHFIEPLESLWRKDDFLRGGELVPDTISPTMLVAIANWEALLMEMRWVLVNLERLVDKMVGDLDVAIGLRRAAIHIEKNIQLSRKSSAPFESRLKLMALDSETGLLDVVASFNVRSPQHLTNVIKSMRVLVREMERVPRRATSAWMVSTEEEISALKKTIDKVNFVIFGPLGNFAMIEE
ncbi:uncharacterized protein ARMOST_15252 [Armillaria ostoyae]|uniref:Uncharacterized protein n=1 Tax=Armillaria ostoyae TaxID=47428 RepID=A0A284RSU5_ARMOS|nr:uncharacterized protein ARMOST_15252 [Armillaria ostoyae]